MTTYLSQEFQRRIMINSSIDCASDISDKKIDAAYQILLSLNSNLQDQVLELQNTWIFTWINWYTVDKNCYLPHSIEDKLDTLRFALYPMNDKTKEALATLLDNNNNKISNSKESWDIRTQQKIENIVIILNDLFINSCNFSAIFEESFLKEQFKYEMFLPHLKVDVNYLNLHEEVKEKLTPDCWREIMKLNHREKNFSQRTKDYNRFGNPILQLDPGLLGEFDDLRIFEK